MTTYTMNLTDKEHRMLKMFATSKGLNIKEYLLSLFEKDLISLNEEENIDNDYHSFEDFNEETQNAIIEAEKNLRKRKQYTNAIELFKACGIKY